MYLLTIYAYFIFLPGIVCFSTDYGFVGSFRYDSNNFNKTNVGESSRYPISFCIQGCASLSEDFHYAGIMNSECYCANDYNISYKETEQRTIPNTKKGLQGNRDRMFIYNLDYVEHMLIMVDASQSFMFDIDTSRYMYSYDAVYSTGHIWTSYFVNWQNEAPEYISLVAQNSNGNLLWYVNVSTVESSDPWTSWMTEDNVITYSNDVDVNSRVKTSDKKLTITAKDDPEKYMFYHWIDDSNAVVTAVSKDNQFYSLDNAVHYCFENDADSTTMFSFEKNVESVDGCLDACQTKSGNTLRLGILRDGDECYCFNTFTTANGCTFENNRDDDQVCVFVQGSNKWCCYKDLDLRNSGCSHRCSLDERRCGSHNHYSLYEENITTSPAVENLLNSRTNLNSTFNVDFESTVFIRRIKFTFESTFLQNMTYTLMYRGIEGDGDDWLQYPNVVIQDRDLESSLTVATTGVQFITNSELNFDVFIYDTASSFLPIDRLTLYGYYHVTEPHRSKWHYLQYLPPAEIEAILRDELEAMQKKLQVNQRNTTSYIRSKESVVEHRPVSTSVGSAYVALILAIVAAIVIFDLSILKAHIKFGYKNLRNFMKKFDIFFKDKGG